MWDYPNHIFFAVCQPVLSVLQVPTEFYNMTFTGFSKQLMTLC